MEVFWRILIFLSSILVGILILVYTNYIVDLVGHNAWAEKYLGLGAGGGTYNMWKIIGILVIIAGIYFAIRGW